MHASFIHEKFLVNWECFVFFTCKFRVLHIFFFFKQCFILPEKMAHLDFIQKPFRMAEKMDRFRAIAEWNKILWIIFKDCSRLCVVNLVWKWARIPLDSFKNRTILLHRCLPKTGEEEKSICQKKRTNLIIQFIVWKNRSQISKGVDAWYALSFFHCKFSNL